MNYEAQGYQSYRDRGEGWELMANFTARITAEIRRHDGLNTSAILTLDGEMPPEDPDDPEKKPTKLPPVKITAEEFAAMNWVMKHWGVRCIIMPGQSIKDDLRTMIQTRSKPKLTNVYQHTGWTEIGRRKVYLHRGGGIGPSGNDPSITVQLPDELRHYDLSCAAEPKEAFKASLDLIGLAPSRPDLLWPLWAATLAPLYGPVDFGVHITGRTGSFKSELASLFQSFYGAGMDARHLPGSWSSTGNANECLAFLACNAVFVVDDYVPGGTNWQQKALAAQADKLFRAQGNQSGRARLTDASSLQKTMYPRGIVFSTGEDTPEGHSVRGRMLIREIATGDIEADELTRCQRLRPLLPGAVAWLAQSLAKEPADLRDRIEEVRNAQRGVGHGRTPTMLGRLVAVAHDVLDRARAAGFLSKEMAAHAYDLARRAILAAGKEQKSFLEDADPVDAFCAAARQVLARRAAHVRQTNGGTPANREQLGWSSKRSMGEMPVFESHGPCIGWVNVTKDELYLDLTAGFPVVRKECGNDMPLSKQTLLKRMKEAGVLLRADEGRGRNTIRVVCEGSVRQVLCLSLSRVMEWKEIKQDGDPEPEEPDELDDDQDAA